MITQQARLFSHLTAKQKTSMQTPPDVVQPTAGTPPPRTSSLQVETFGRFLTH